MKNVERLIATARRNQAKFEKLAGEEAQLEAQAAKIREQIKALKWRLDSLELKIASKVSERQDRELDSIDALYEARLLYTADMDGPSEERARAWYSFLEQHGL